MSLTLQMRNGRTHGLKLWLVTAQAIGSYRGAPSFQSTKSYWERLLVTMYVPDMAPFHISCTDPRGHKTTQSAYLQTGCRQAACHII